MVARLSEMPALWLGHAASRPGNVQQHVPGIQPVALAIRGQMLLERASTLAYVTAGGRGIPCFEGIPLHLENSACHAVADYFIRDRIFAVIGGDGSMCLRLPKLVGEDLAENGLCLKAGKNLLTWPINNRDQLERSWRILLHAYWGITETSPRRARRLLSEWIIQY